MELLKFICKRCGHKWIPRKETPKVCPNCKRTDWNNPSKKRRAE